MVWDFFSVPVTCQLNIRNHQSEVGPETGTFADIKNIVGRFSAVRAMELDTQHIAITSIFAHHTLVEIKLAQWMDDGP